MGLLQSVGSCYKEGIRPIEEVGVDGDQLGYHPKFIQAGWDL